MTNSADMDHQQRTILVSKCHADPATLLYIASCKVNQYLTGESLMHYFGAFPHNFAQVFKDLNSSSFNR